MTLAEQFYQWLQFYPVTIQFQSETVEKILYDTWVCAEHIADSYVQRAIADKSGIVVLTKQDVQPLFSQKPILVKGV
jgi:hypothetical protein